MQVVGVLRRLPCAKALAWPWWHHMEEVNEKSHVLHPELENNCHYLQDWDVPNSAPKIVENNYEA